MTAEAKDKLGRWVVLGSLIVALIGTARGLIIDASSVGGYKAGFENVCAKVEKITSELDKNDARDQVQDKDIAELKISARNSDVNMERVIRTTEEIQRDIKILLARKP